MTRTLFLSFFFFSSENKMSTENSIMYIPKTEFRKIETQGKMIYPVYQVYFSCPRSWPSFGLDYCPKYSFFFKKPVNPFIIEVLGMSVR